jgi:hypothetical protein
MRVAISQSMYFPWVGLLEQIRLADVFIHYDDVQFSKGGFTNRVQVKTARGMVWMTAPLCGLHLGQTIDGVRLQASRRWRDHHLALLRESFKTAEFADEAVELARSVIDAGHVTISELARASMLGLTRFFSLDKATRFIDSKDFGIGGSGSQRVLALVKAVGGSDYITGHGARNYLDHEMFEAAGVNVSYMDYQCVPYPQDHGSFTPYVTGLDLAAHCGRNGAAMIRPRTRDWKEFLDGSS